MNSRFVASKCIPLYVLATTLTAVVPFAGQVPSSSAQKTPAKTWTVPRTPDGKPDLQGIWNNATLTPLERSKEYEGKPFLNEQEVAEFEKRELRNVDGDRRDGGAAADVGRAYNEFWRNRGRITPDRRTSLVVDPPDGRVPPLTPTAQKRAADRAAQNRGHEFDGPENRSLAERCIAVPNAGPPMIPANYNANYQILQAPGVVALLSEQIHDARIIPTDGRPHLPENIRQLMGDSRGHWEGDTLVVETINFTGQTNFRGSGAYMRLIERFTLTSPDMILYEFTVNDPETFTRPWTARIPMIRAQGPIFEYACQEGNYGLAGSLSGARAEEKAAAEAAKKGSK
jgi:hypothetical protein